MLNRKQTLIEDTAKEIVEKEEEITNSDAEIAILRAKIKVEIQTLNMDDLEGYLREEFEYSLNALRSTQAMEEEINSRLKMELDMLAYRKKVIESQFSDNDLNF